MTSGEIRPVVASMMKSLRSEDVLSDLMKTDCKIVNVIASSMSWSIAEIWDVIKMKHFTLICFNDTLKNSFSYQNQSEFWYDLSFSL